MFLARQCASGILELQLQSSRRWPCQSPVPCTKCFKWTVEASPLYIYIPNAAGYVWPMLCSLFVTFFFPGSPMVSIWCFGDPEALVSAPDLGFYLLVVLISASPTTRQGSQLRCCWTRVIQDKISHSLSFVSDMLASIASCGPAAWEQRTQDQFLM